MAKSNIIAGLDIGTTKISLAIGVFQEGVPRVIGLAHTPNHGTRQGVITDIDDTVSALAATLEEGEKMCGSQITNVIVGITGQHITALPSKGVTAVTRADGEIMANDVDRALEAARAIAMPPNREIIHTIAKNFTIDGQDTLKDPVGMKGIRLEIEALLINGSTNAIKNIVRAVNQAGLQIDAMIFSPLACAKALLNKDQKDSGVILIDIGASSTGIIVYEEGEILHTSVLPIGSRHITNDIAIGLRTNLEAAEKIKIKFGHAVPEAVKETEMIDLNHFDKKESTKVARRYVADIIQARLNELFAMITEELRAISRDGSLPAGAVFTGGGSQLEGLTDLAKDALRLPATIGSPGLEISGMVDKLDNPIYSTSIGLMLEGLEQNGPSKQGIGVDTSTFSGVLDKAKAIFRQFLP